MKCLHSLLKLIQNVRVIPSYDDTFEGNDRDV